MTPLSDILRCARQLEFKHFQMTIFSLAHGRKVCGKLGMQFLFGWEKLSPILLQGRSKMENRIFNPLDKENIGKSVSAAILSQPVIPLQELQEFIGAGVYAIYYRGDFPLYRKITDANIEKFTCPIYAGKAVPQGARKGNVILDSLSGNDLYRRLNDHKKSILATSNLNINDFYYRYLIVDDIWIPLGESVLIQQTKPLWNNVVDGFGNHDPGSGRGKQQRSPWDMLHPGRTWAEKLAEGKSVKEIEKSILDFFSK